MSVQSSIESKLQQALSPSFLQVENESHQHNVSAGSESHFKVTVVAEGFDGMLPIARHRKVYSILSDEMAGQIHALALHTFTDSEWQQKVGVTDSPPCLGGSKHDR